MSKTDDHEIAFIDTINDEKLKQTTQIFSDIMDSINDPKLEGKKDQIMEWIQTNDTRIPQLDRKGFMNEISKHCGDKKIKGSLGKIWKQYHVELVQYSVSTPGPAPNTTATTETDLDHKGQEEEEPQPTQVTIAPIFSDIIDPIKYTKLEGKTNKIMEWIKANEARIPELDRKGFMNAISNHCGDKKIKGALGKVWTQYNAARPPLNQLEANDSIGTETDMKSMEIDIGRAAAITEDTESKHDIFREFSLLPTRTDEDEESDSDSCYADADRVLVASEEMPTYIHRAIWFRSDDETLERLVDRAVAFVCKSPYWDKPEFIRNLYDAWRFQLNVETVCDNYVFFEAFAHDTFGREILLNALYQEEFERFERYHHHYETEQTNTDSITRCYRSIDRSQYVQADTDSDSDELHEYDVYKQQRRTKNQSSPILSEYHIHRVVGVMTIHTRERADDMPPTREFHVNETMSKKFKWAVWTRKRKRVERDQFSKGYWKVLNANNVRKGVPIPHLNLLFELLRSYYPDKTKRDRQLSKPLEETGQSLLGRSRLPFAYDHHAPRRKDVHIKLYGEYGESESHYVLTWWNCKNWTDCFAIAIRIHNSTPDREWYYMRFNVDDLKKKDETKLIEWLWYDNNNNKYSTFPDHELLHMQIEATYQANLNSNFPWKWFTDFNSAQLTHLRSVLREQRGSAADAYLLRFTRLEYEEEEMTSEDMRKARRLQKKHMRQSNSQMDPDFVRDQTPRSVHIILSMEQVAVTESVAYQRGLKRLRDGRDSLKAQRGGSDAFINHWLKKYQLATEAQKKYFWSFILTIATKIKLMDIEIENQLVTIPIRETASIYNPQLSNAGAEVTQEQHDALLYKGFLVPPVSGEFEDIACEIQSDANRSDESYDIRDTIEKRSITKVLQRFKVKEQGLINYDVEDEDFVYVHEVGGDQYLEREANLFRFAEIVRKFIIESKYLQNDSSLWPYYMNNSHVEDHDAYHSLVNRFKLMFNKQNIFELFCTQSDDKSLGCIHHISCNDSTSNKPTDDVHDLDAIVFRHRRKSAATLLLQPWNTLRNLNILRQQLIVIFNRFVDKDSTQKEMIAKANELTRKKWIDAITDINRELETHIKRNKAGWQLLSEYGNLKDNHPIDISVKQYPFFESFCAHFLFEGVIEHRKKLMDPSEDQWFRAFKQSWSAIPQWWAPKHDLVLLELALKYNINHARNFTEDLRGEKGFYFRMRLGDRTNYWEFTRFCDQSSNILHRLSHITRILVDMITRISPSLVDIRVPRNQRNEYPVRDESFIFSNYDKKTHLQYVNRRVDEIENYKPATQQAKENYDPAEHEKYTEILGPVVADLALLMREEWPMTSAPTELMDVETNPLLSDSMTQTTEAKIDDEEEEDDEEDDEHEFEFKELEDAQPTKKKKKIKVDPFISRDLEIELCEVINAFDMRRYGRHMAQFVINQMKEFEMAELWTILGVVMESIPFQVAEKLLHSEILTLERGTPEQLETLCLKIVNATHWKIPSALRMAVYIKRIGDVDFLYHKDWVRTSHNFENYASELVHNIESTHLLQFLLTIPLYDTAAPMNIIKLALKQKHTSFLCNDRILNVMNHIWYHGASIDIKKDLKADSVSFTELLPILCFTPFKFYILPVGYNFTINILFGMYLVYVLWYSFWVVNGTATPLSDTVLWILALGFVFHEVFEWVDKGREYFAVSGLMNIWDIMISICWILLFIIHWIINPNGYPHRETMIEENVRAVLLKVYALLFGLQIFLLCTRFLTLFQNTQYLGGLLKIVQMMGQEIFKFFSVAIVVIAAFVFSFYFVYGLENITDEETETPVGFWATMLFSFDLFIGGGTNDESYVGAAFTVFLTVCGGLVMTNLLIALMTTKYDTFQETAQKEVHFLKIESVMDLAYRDRLMPPPLNVIVYPLGIVIHLFVTLCALTCCNCYERINRGTYLFLDTCYCGCNRLERRYYEIKRYERRDQNQYVYDDMVQEKLYQLDCCSLCMAVSGLSYFLLPFRKQCYKCCGGRRCPRRSRFVDEELEEDCCECMIRLLRYDEKVFNKEEKAAKLLTAYHKGCYNCMKLKKDDTIIVRGITMRDYISKYKHAPGVKSHLRDIILLQQLTTDTLFCDYCHQPYLEHQLNHSLLPPFRVLMDIISCFTFLITWVPLMVFFVLMVIIEQMMRCLDKTLHDRDAHTE